MTESVLSQALAWGFVCHSEHDETQQILPQEKNERWKLQLQGNRWLLIVDNVPQINFYPDEAINFLELRRSSLKDKEFNP